MGCTPGCEFGFCSVVEDTEVVLQRQGSVVSAKSRERSLKNEI